MAQQLRYSAQIQVDAQLGTATRYSNSALQLDRYRTATRQCKSAAEWWHSSIQQLGCIEMLMVDVRVAGHRTHQGAQPHKETTDLWHTSGTTTLAATAKSDGSLHDYYRA
mmetsp:Transcript_12794/g.28880  ORF Transcript_12794/g.28880 Transcript_12794/m.28880 type:complete len:110 (+) Transcript_12794:308-637(+)